MGGSLLCFVGRSDFQASILTLTRIIHDAWRRNGESLLHWGIAANLWFQQFNHDWKLTNLQHLSPLQKNRLKGQAKLDRRAKRFRRLSS
jgi:hypothetical protein